jgi:DNA repair protein RecO (recombination protein O)
MQWSDDALILGVRRHGEDSVIVEAMTLAHGRHLGLVRGGRSARMRALLQPGNDAAVVWRARLEEHLGVFSLEPGALRAASLMASRHGLFGLQTLAAHLRLLPERDPHPALQEAARVVLDHMDDPPVAAALLVRFELALLEELGFGLDLSSCAATGTRTGLAWVSPKSGRAVSREAGAPWASRLLVLPQFLTTGGEVQVADLEAGMALTFHFLCRDIYEPRGIRPPDERAGFRDAVLATDPATRTDE